MATRSYSYRYTPIPSGGGTTLGGYAKPTASNTGLTGAVTDQSLASPYRPSTPQTFANKRFTSVTFQPQPGGDLTFTNCEFVSCGFDTNPFAEAGGVTGAVSTASDCYLHGNCSVQGWGWSFARTFFDTGGGEWFRDVGGVDADHWAVYEQCYFKQLVPPPSDPELDVHLDIFQQVWRINAANYIRWTGCNFEMPSLAEATAAEMDHHNSALFNFGRMAGAAAADFDVILEHSWFRGSSYQVRMGRFVTVRNCRFAKYRYGPFLYAGTSGQLADLVFTDNYAVADNGSVSLIVKGVSPFAYAG